MGMVGAMVDCLIHQRKLMRKRIRQTDARKTKSSPRVCDSAVPFCAQLAVSYIVLRIIETYFGCFHWAEGDVSKKFGRRGCGQV